MNKMNITSLLLGMVQTNCYLIQNKDTQEVLIVDPADNAGRIQQKLQEMGVIVLTAGTDTIRLLPPLVITNEEIDQALACMKEVLK